MEAASSWPGQTKVSNSTTPGGTLSLLLLRLLVEPERPNRTVFAPTDGDPTVPADRDGVNHIPVPEQSPQARAGPVVPQFERLVGGTGQEGRSVRGERQRGDGVLRMDGPRRKCSALVVRSARGATALCRLGETVRSRGKRDPPRALRYSVT